MCGINGVFAPGLESAALGGAAERMTAALSHRGPDAHGIHVDLRVPVALGHARLSIIDLSDAAGQPMSSPDDQYVIVFNGEVYNFNELRRELEPTRHFSTRSDTEVVLAAYEKWGTAAFTRLNGMFALAILDRRRGRLVLSRDRLGIKPLFVSCLNGNVVFGSEIKALLASGLVPASVDTSQLHEYLYFGNTLGAGTFYKGIERFPPGSWLAVDMESGQRIGPEAYWSVPQAFANGGDAGVSGIDDPRRHTADLLSAAVKRQLVSDVPVGVFLSGGVDSTAIVALASQHYGSRLRTYSVGFDYLGDGEELPTARWVAERFGTEHHELHVSAANITDTVEKMVQAHDQPFGDAANLPLFQLCQAVNGETKVILQGDGGDELFGGYRRYSYLRVPAMRRIAKLAAAGLTPLQGASGYRAFGPWRFFSALSNRDPAERMALLLSVETPFESPTRVLSPALREAIAGQDPFARYREISHHLPATDPLQAMLWTDLQILLPDIFLEKVDRSTMAASMEVRVPFLDHDLVDYVGALPSRLKVGINARKLLLKSALKGTVPERILQARKVGFGVPVSRWLAGPLRRYAEDRILGTRNAKNWFDADTIRCMFKQHARGDRDHSQLLWKALQLALWCEQHGAAA